MRCQHYKFWCTVLQANHITHTLKLLMRKKTILQFCSDNILVRVFFQNTRSYYYCHYFIIFCHKHVFQILSSEEHAFVYFLRNNSYMAFCSVSLTCVSLSFFVSLCTMFKLTQVYLMQTLIYVIFIFLIIKIVQASFLLSIRGKLQAQQGSDWPQIG